MVKGTQCYAVVDLIWTMPGIPLDVRSLKPERAIAQAPVIATNGTPSLIGAQHLLTEARCPYSTEDSANSVSNYPREPNGLSDRIMHGGRPELIEELLRKFRP